MLQSAQEIPLKLILKTSWFFKRQVFLVGMIAGLVFMGASFVVFPNSYESVTTIRMNTAKWQEAINPNPNSKTPLNLAFSKTELLSKSNLSKTMADLKSKYPEEEQSFIITFLESYGLKKKPASEDLLIQYLQKTILVDTPDILRPNELPERFTIKYQDNDFDRAGEFTRILISYYSKDRDTNMTDYFDKIIAEAKQQLIFINAKIDEIEKDITHSVQSNSDILLIRDNLLAGLSDTRKSLTETKLLITELENRKLSLERLITKTPQYLVNHLEGESTIKPTSQLIKEDMAKLTELQATYTDAHPEIARLKREIEAYKKNPTPDVATSTPSTYKTNTTPNVEYSTLQKDLITVEANLARARAQQTELERVIRVTETKSGETALFNSLVKERNLLLDKFNTMKVNAETKLASAEIRRGFVNSGYIPLVEIVDSITNLKSPPKPRYILMLASIGIGLVVGLIVVMVRSYFILKHTQAMYGYIRDVSDFAKISLLETHMDEETGDESKIYKLSAPLSTHKGIVLYTNSELVENERSGEWLEGPNDNIRPLSTLFSEDAFMIRITDQLCNSLQKWWYYPLVTTGYIGLIALVAIEYLSQHYTLLP